MRGSYIGRPPDDFANLSSYGPSFALDDPGGIRIFNGHL